MEIRRTLLWMILALALLLLWNNWQTYHGGPSLFSAPTPQSAAPAAATDTAAQASVPSVAMQPDATTAGLPASAAATDAGETVQIATDVYQLTFNTLGAQLVRAELPRFKAVEDAGQNMVLLDNAPGTFYVAQSGVVGAPQGQFPTHLTPFQWVPGATTMTGDTLDVVFTATAGDLQVVKTYTLSRGRYDIAVKHTLTNQGNVAVTPALYLQLTRNDNDPPDTSFFYKTFTGPVVYSDAGRFQKVSFSDIEKNKANYIQQANDGWIGMVQHYFATAWIPREGQARNNELLRLPNTNQYVVRAVESVGALAPGQSTVVPSTLWLGPQDQQAMSAIAPGLELVVDYGWLTIIAKPLFTLMTWLHALLGNWGWTIVVLTLLIKLAFYPLSAASYRSMAKMKHVTPRMQALREKFGDDRAKLNQAMMEMYRTEKINPLGGCLPMLVQIPVFIALYWVLLGSVEMRGAPWLLWVQDLSVRDPWFILPAIMMATMFLQIKLNPRPPDPMQARIMMLMPLVFGGMMFFFPAGLVLYWCVNNTVSIAQQRYIMHKLDKAAAARS